MTIKEVIARENVIITLDDGTEMDSEKTPEELLFILSKGNTIKDLCTDPQMLDQKSNDWRSIFLWLNIVLNLKRK